MTNREPRGRHDCVAPTFLLTGTGETESYGRGYLAYVGLAETEVSGWDWRWAIHPADLPRVRRAWRRSLQTGEPHQTRFRLRRADGVYCWHVGRAIPVRDDTGHVARWFGTCHAVKGGHPTCRRRGTWSDEPMAGS